MSIISDIDSMVTQMIDGIMGSYHYMINNPDAIAFLIVSVIAIVSAIFVVVSEEIVHSAFYLALTTICVAVTFFFMQAEFVAVVQLMIYVGAVTVLFAFSIMLTRNKIMQKKDDEEGSK